MNRQKQFRKIVDVFAKIFANNVCPRSCWRRGHGNDYADNRKQILRDYTDTRTHDFRISLRKRKSSRNGFSLCSCEAQVESFEEKNKGRKSRQTVPLRACATIVSLSYQTTPSGPLIHRQPRDIFNCIKHTSYVAKLFDSTVQLHNKHYKISVADPDLQ